MAVGFGIFWTGFLLKLYFLGRLSVLAEQNPPPPPFVDI